MKEKSKTSLKLKKALKRVLLGVLAVVLILTGVVAVIAGKNVKAMNHCADAAIAELRSHYTVAEMISTAVFQLPLGEQVTIKSAIKKSDPYRPIYLEYHKCGTVVYSRFIQHFGVILMKHSIL